MTLGPAVNHEGILIQCYAMPDNQHDSHCVEQEQSDLNSSNLGRVVWVMDRGMTSQNNMEILQRSDRQYILGEKLSGSKLNEQALSHPGSFKVVSDSQHIREIDVGEESAEQRYVDHQ